MYKGIIILYLAIFSSYVLFSRAPDYVGADFIKGIVTRATFSEKTNSPELVVNYRVGSETLQYKTNTWFLSSYKTGQRVTIIYNPDHPAVSSIYAFIGYWIKWPELIFTAFFFLALFLVARTIAGNERLQPDKNPGKKKKYDV